MAFNKYPYSDFHEMNLDWVIEKIKYIEQAANIVYDPDTSGLSATNVQSAIDEIINMISSQGVVTFNGRAGVVVPMSGDYDGTMITYDNTVSGLAATDTQNAIDEIVAGLPASTVESFNTRTGAVTAQASDYDADQIDYDNTNSGLAATDSQAAIDELAARPLGGVESFNARTGAVTPQSGDYAAADIPYVNTTSGMTADDVQEAIDELDDRIDNFSVAASNVSYNNSVSGLQATDAQDAIDEVSNLVLSSGVASFNGRTGAVNPTAGDYDLTEMGDVNISTPTDGQALIYDGNSSKWINGTGGSSVSALDDLSDVTITTPSDGQFLKYDSNSSQWVNGIGCDPSTITSIIATGATNTTGSTIPNGAYFYLNGSLCRAIADIATNASFTLNTNFVTTTISEGLQVEDISSAFAADVSDFTVHYAKKQGNIISLAVSGTLSGGYGYIGHITNADYCPAYSTTAVVSISDGGYEILSYGTVGTGGGIYCVNKGYTGKTNKVIVTYII